ncbi:MAG: S41 family peptidase [bacterium]
MRIKLSYRKIRGFFLGLTVITIVFAGGYETAKYRLGQGSNKVINKFIGNPAQLQPQGADFARFWDVWKRLEQSYVDPEQVNYQKMTWGAIQGLAQSLGDPYTQYLPPDDNKRVNEDLSGSFYGVGIELGYKDSTLVVVAPLAGTPAEKAGVQAGDFILHIKDEQKQVDVDTRGIALLDAVDKIRGPLGTPVILTLYREGVAESFEVTISRGEIVVPTIEVKYLDYAGKKYALLQLHRFGGRTDNEWLEKVGEIEANKVAGVILDLRNNPGGYLDGAVFVAGEFLSSGAVVEQQGRNQNETYQVDRKGSLLGMPLVVLINKGSASASEITAGALQDHKRAKVVGETSFGKGTVQEVQEMSDGSSLHVTIAKWLTPEGKWINKEGITPDVEAKDDPNTKDVDEVVEAALKQF